MGNNRYFRERDKLSLDRGPFVEALCFASGMEPTGVVVGVTSDPADPKVFRADHPFLLMIRDNRTGSILFMGPVVFPGGL